MKSDGIPQESQQTVGRRALLRRRAIASLCAMSLMLQQGCYSAVPVTGGPVIPLNEVTIQMNDRGRLLVGNRLGPLVDKLRGRVVRVDSAQVEIAVETAEDVRGKVARWGGERFTIPREGILIMDEKKLAKKRTWLLVGALAVGVAVFYIGGKALSIFGSNGSTDGGTNPI